MIENLIDNPEILLEGPAFIALIGAYVGGILASFSPCVYPVIPITVAFIGAHRDASRLRGFILSALYVVGLAATYTALGAFAALTGRLFGQVQTNPWLHLIVANICIVMGLSLLGLFTIAIPTPSFATKLQAGGPQKGILGSLFIGALSGLIMGPCTTPILAVLLSFIAAKQNLLFGMILMFVFALGMGTLLIVVGTFARLLARIPRSGLWMVRINNMFGLILIAAGEYFLIKAGSLWV
ncbi:MAG: sulfite exporter TauE/SafE family protein [Deltaproteobacteria bacterium]|nr:sulfite exporter TauE/SafE family protein [Deltaproteobacteria bacterium]